MKKFILKKKKENIDIKILKNTEKESILKIILEPKDIIDNYTILIYKGIKYKINKRAKKIKDKDDLIKNSKILYKCQYMKNNGNIIILDSLSSLYNLAMPYIMIYKKI